MALLTSKITVNEILPGVTLMRPAVYADDRGFVLEIFRETALGARFVQANHSRSKAGVLRGLHYHRHQADAWYLVAGAARVGLADLRASLEHPPALTLDLDATSPAVLYIPPGVAHGYLALANVDLIYWTTEYYDGADEHSIAWNDATLAVPWRATDPVLSARDRAAPLFDRNAVAVALGRP